MKNKIINKSSVVRIIISNYDTCSIKELKIIHVKKALLDCIEITKMELDKDSKKILFKDAKPKKINDNTLQNITVTNLEDGNLEVSSNGDENQRVYRISGEYFRKSDSNRYKNATHKIDKTNLNGITVKVTVEMLKHPAQLEERYNLRRREVTSTERKLLSENQLELYSKISLEDSNMIDSKKIYQINRFLNYRSNFLLYFPFINNLFIQYVKEDKNEQHELEIWEIFNPKKRNKEKDLNDMVTGIRKILSQTITDKNAKIEEYNKNLPRGKKAIQLYKSMTNEELKADIEKIIILYSEFRHTLMHYEYKTFNDLYQSQEVILGKTVQYKLSELLNLNLFKLISHLKDFNEVSKSLYIEKEDSLYILGKTRKLMSLHKIYWLLCERKNGFNKFINGLFAHEGLEDKAFKAQINEDFRKRIEFLKTTLSSGKVNDITLKPNTKKSMEAELALKQEQLKDVNEAYIDDIHYNVIYKLEYVNHQKLCLQVNQLINEQVQFHVNHKEKIRRLNKEIASSKSKMEKITKRNSLIRLEYKLRVAFNFLAKEFNLDIKSFKNIFNPLEEMKYVESKSEYISYMPNVKLEFNLGKIEKELSVEDLMKSMLDVSPENNLFKFSLITYLLLPKEIRGNYLGIMKKYYYDIKNFNQEDNTSFFHNLRLFDKNTRKFEIFDYDLSSDEKINKKLETLKTDMNIAQTSNAHIEQRINRSLITMIFGYYRNIFSYLNSFELSLLLNEAINRNKSIKDIQEKCYKGDYYNFRKLCKITCTTDTILDKTIKIRNKISHLNYSNLFNLQPSEEFCGLKRVNCVLYVETSELFDKINKLNNNPWNDLKMRDSQLSFKLLKDSTTELIDQNEDSVSIEEKMLMDKYQLTTLDSVFQFVVESKAKLNEFANKPQRNFIDSFLDLEFTSEKHNRLIRVKIRETNLDVNKKQVVATINKELEQLENICVKAQIKEMKEKFVQIVKLN